MAMYGNAMPYGARPIQMQAADPYGAQAAAGYGALAGRPSVQMQQPQAAMQQPQAGAYPQIIPLTQSSSGLAASAPQAQVGHTPRGLSPLQPSSSLSQPLPPQAAPASNYQHHQQAHGHQAHGQQLHGQQSQTLHASRSREEAQAERIKELELLVREKDELIKDLEGELSRRGSGGNSARVHSARAGGQKMKGGRAGGASSSPGPGRPGNGSFRKLAQARPAAKYNAVDQDDPIDGRLEEFYNSTGSAIPFQRINKGFYRFGDSLVELDIINHKLMARTEDGWNRGKYGTIEKFLSHYEGIEREKAGIQLD